VVAGDVATNVQAPVLAWAASGAMALTGRADGPGLGPPAGFVERVGSVGRRLGVDGLGLVGERAAIAGWTRRGDLSCGGATRLLPAADGWVALSLARDDDLALVPALLEDDRAIRDPWPRVASAARTRPAADLVARARLLGLPAAVLPDVRPVPPPAIEARPAGASAAARPVAGARVVDLSSLWAGPLCGALLAAAGADVVKVESTARPDGARSGPATFFDLLNGDKRTVALDLTARDGVAALVALLRTADVVIEGSRPRALEQMGVDRLQLAAEDGPQVWVSITGYGRAEPMREWVAFGDDAAVGGGLIARDASGPCFCADAVADPLTGMVAAVAALDALAAGGRHLVDVAMAGVAAAHAGPTLAVPDGVEAAPPTARRPHRRAAALGAHTAAVLQPLAG
jgi:hypothetical protein